MGHHSDIAHRVDVYNLGPVTMGDHAVVSHDAVLCAGTHDYRSPVLPLERPGIVIEDGVWVCTGAFVGPGVTVGMNSVVGARAVVMRDVPRGVIVGGNPARVVRARLAEWAGFVDRGGGATGESTDGEDLADE